MPDNTEEIRHAHKSKYNLKRENQVILLIITNGKKWHYLPVETLSALLKASKSDEDCYCLICLHSYKAEHNLKNHYNVCKNHGYCYLEMTKEDKKYQNTTVEENL